MTTSTAASIVTATTLWSCMIALVASKPGQGVIEKLLTIRTCGKPNIQNMMTNVTASPGQTATFKCQVDMSCIVAYIEWYHRMDNGTQKLIKTASSAGDPHVHMINEVTTTDKGLYTCIAGNVLGQSVASAYLDVNSGARSRTSSISLSSSSLPLAMLALVLIFTSLHSSCGNGNSGGVAFTVDHDKEVDKFSNSIRSHKCQSSTRGTSDDHAVPIYQSSSTL